MKKSVLSCLMGIISVSGMAVTPMWLRDVQISPNGKEIVFCYKGDIYKVPAAGGEAIRLTTQDSYECSPVWSRDGRIAFASNRYGNFDVFVMSAKGGEAKRLTFNSASEIPTAFHESGHVYFTASIQDPASSALYPTSAMSELYRVWADGGSTEQVLATPAEMVHFLPGGDSFLYQDRKGFEDEWRKHHTSSVSRDIWMYDAASGKHINLTNRPGEDRNPVVAADGKVYFLSERDKGSFNVYSFSQDNPKEVSRLTSFNTHPVRFLSTGGGTLCYTYDGEIYTQRLGGTPQKVAVTLTHDEAEMPASLSFTRGVSEATVSPDGKQVAFVVRGEVFVTSTNYETTKQITRTVEAEEGVSFGADNRSLVYAGERNGNWTLYTAKIVREEDPNFANATLIEEKELLSGKDGIERQFPKFSPDGKEVAFVEDRKRLMVLNIASGKVRQITDGSAWYENTDRFSYDWSPDGQWFTLTFIGNRHDPYTDIALVSADGKGKPVNLTNSGYTSGSPRWVMGGNAILFITERYGMRNHASWGSQDDVMLAFVNKDAYDKYRLSKEDYELLKEIEKEQEKKDTKDTEDKEAKKEDKKIVVELEGIEDRIVRLTPNSSSLSSAMISKDGESLYYLSAFEGGFDMWKMDLRKHETKLLHKMDAGWGDMETDKEGKTLFVLSGNSLQQMDFASETLKPITFRAEFKLDKAAERAYMFDHVYKQEKKCFYVKDMHGVDWEAMTKAYRKFLPHINNNYDFAELLSEWLGELNVSHTGGRYRPSVKTENTANLGLLYDWNHKGNGLRVAEVVEKGPFDRKTTRIAEGVIIEKIDGEILGKDRDHSLLLNGKAGRKVLVSLYNPQTKERWDEVVKPITSGRFNGLLYNRWVKQRADDVKKWSGGRLGYVHIESMDDGSFRTVYSDILGKYNNCEGIVIDTRFNGGGRLHEDIEVLFSGEKYLTQVARGREACDMPSRRWNKPSIMVQCEANYSNAHGTPWVYKYRNIGKLVGTGVPGTMTTVSWETLQDPTLIFGIPIIGYRLADGSYLENTQLEPDVHVLNAPETVVKGEDTQLKVAVDELLRQLDGKK